MLNAVRSRCRVLPPVPLSRHLREQLDRAASSIALNLAEGCGRETKAEQIRFFTMAFARLRESQAILALEISRKSDAAQAADKLAAYLYRLVQNVTANR